MAAHLARRLSGARQSRTVFAKPRPFSSIHCPFSRLGIPVVSGGRGSLDALEDIERRIVSSPPQPRLTIGLAGDEIKTAIKIT